MPSSPLPFLFDAAIQFSQRFFGAGEKATAPAATVDSVAEVPRAYKLPPKAKKAPKVEAPAAAAPSADVPSADAPSAETAELVADAAALRAEVEADAAGAFHAALDVSTRPSSVGTGASPQPTPLPAFRAAVAAAVAEAVTTMQAEAAASIAKLEARLVDAEAEAKRAREAEAAALARLATSPATLQPSTPERAPPDQSLLGAAIDEAPPALRGSAQGLINIFNAVGTLLAVTCIGAIADFEGGGLTGFSHAYLVMGLSMLVMLVVAFGLKKKLNASV
jgi:hypothetical protein